jgi:hypothetical protein
MVAAVLAFVGGRLAPAADATTLTGEFTSTYQDGEKPVEATFTATGERTWDVVFRFRFDGAAHAYRGTAEGDLGRGDLRGTVASEGGSRTFVFRGRFEGGVFRGTHAELHRGREDETGRITLRG